MRLKTSFKALKIKNETSWAIRVQWVEELSEKVLADSALNEGVRLKCLVSGFKNENIASSSKGSVDFYAGGC